MTSRIKKITGIFTNGKPFYKIVHHHQGKTFIDCESWDTKEEAMKALPEIEKDMMEYLKLD
jgi:hypothetical protein